MKRRENELCETSRADIDIALADMKKLEGKSLTDAFKALGKQVDDEILRR